jgi:DNA polymerase V
MYNIQILLTSNYLNRLYNFDLSYMQDNSDLRFFPPVEKFCVRITGESMVQAGIKPGDVVEVVKNMEVVNNDIILAKVNGIHTIKRLQINHDHTYTLLPENIDFDPIIIDESMDFEIEGIVTRVVK